MSSVWAHLVRLIERMRGRRSQADPAERRRIARSLDRSRTDAILQADRTKYVGNIGTTPSAPDPESDRDRSRP